MTFRDVVAAGVFLAGASWLWLTPMWLAQGRSNVSIFDPRGLLSVLTVIGFAAVAWGVFRSAPWWEPLAIATALVGIAASLIFWLSNASSAGASQTDVAMNCVLHIAAAGLVIAVLLVKPAEHWLAGHL